MAQMLIEKGADVSVSTKNGMTPLHYAEKGQHKAMVQLLIEKCPNTAISR
jgi:ankyrin repeat protein